MEIDEVMAAFKSLNRLSQKVVYEYMLTVADIYWEESFGITEEMPWAERFERIYKIIPGVKREFVHSALHEPQNCYYSAEREYWSKWRTRWLKTKEKREKDLCLAVKNFEKLEGMWREHIYEYMLDISRLNNVECLGITSETPILECFKRVFDILPDTYRERVLKEIDIIYL